MTSIGTLGQLSVRGKSGQRRDYLCPRRLAKRSPRICGMDDRIAPVAAYFYAPKPPSAAFAGEWRWIDRSPFAPARRHRCPYHGAHQFRHGLATEMLRQGASLSEIGELLGHRSPETTKIYTKVDLEALRTLALPWPGGVR